MYRSNWIFMYKSFGVVPSRHLVFITSIRGLRPRLSKSCAFVVPSRHLAKIINDANR